MADKQRFTVEQVEQALRKNLGLVAPTARALGCSTQSVRNYLKRYKRLRDVCHEVREAMLDLAESRVAGAVQKGDMFTIRWYLDRLGHDRGYGQTLRATAEHTAADGSTSSMTIYLPAERDE